MVYCVCRYIHRYLGRGGGMGGSEGAGRGLIRQMMDRPPGLFIVIILHITILPEVCDAYHPPSAYHTYHTPIRYLAPYSHMLHVT